MFEESDEVALIRAVVAAPDDDTPRLVYADWLDDHGRHDRARLIRVQCQIEQLEAEERSLIDRFGQEWAGELFAVGGDNWAFRRGFPEEVTLHFRDFMTHHDQLNDVTPLCRLRLVGRLSDDVDADLAALARLPAARQIRALEFVASPPDPTHPTYGTDGVRSLSTSPNLVGLRELVLHSPRVGPDGVAALAESPFLSNLTHLAVTAPECASDETTLLRFVRSPHLSNLDTVQLGDTGPISVRNIRTVAARATALQVL